MAKLEAGMTFDSYAELTEALNRFCDANHVLFVKKQSVKTRNPLVKEKLVYDSIIYKCKQGYEPHKSKCRGIRPNQSTYSVGCRAKVRVSRIDDDEKSYFVLKEVDLEHSGHEVSPQVYASYPEVRRRNLRNKGLSILARDSSLRVRDLHNLLSSSTDKVIHYSDVSNFLYKMRHGKGVAKQEVDPDADMSVEEIVIDGSTSANSTVVTPGKMAHTEGGDTDDSSGGTSSSGNTGQMNNTADVIMSLIGEDKLNAAAVSEILLPPKRVLNKRKEQKSLLSSIKRPISHPTMSVSMSPPSSFPDSPPPLPSPQKAPLFSIHRQQPKPRPYQHRSVVNSSGKDTSGGTLTPQRAVQQFKRAQLLGTEMAEFLSECGEVEFESRMAQMAQICQSWTQGKDVITIEVDRPAPGPSGAAPVNVTPTHISGHFQKPTVSLPPKVVAAANPSQAAMETEVTENGDFSPYGHYSIIIKEEPVEDMAMEELSQPTSEPVVPPAPMVVKVVDGEALRGKRKRSSESEQT